MCLATSRETKSLNLAQLWTLTQENIVAKILSIINKIPLGKHRVDVALKLREAMLINGILYNSEACHGMTDAYLQI